MKVRGHIRSLGVAAGVAAFAAALLLAPGTAAAQAEDPTFTRRRGAHPAALLPDLPPRGGDRPDVAADLRGDAALGPLHPREGRDAEHASLVHRQEHRRAGLQVRPLAERRRDRDHRRLGRRGRPRAATRPDMPPPVEFADRDIWHTGEPDWIVPIPEPFVVPAEGANWWGDLFSESGLTEDRWIKAVETKPSAEGFPVVHHAVTRLQESIDSDEGDFLNEYAQGKNGDRLPRGDGAPSSRRGRSSASTCTTRRSARSGPTAPASASRSTRRARSRSTSSSRGVSARTTTSTSRPARTTYGTTATTPSTPTSA